MTVDNYYFKMRKRNNVKLNEDLLNEELNRFNAINAYDSEEGLINEFNFHVSEKFYDTDNDELLEADDEESGDDDIDAAIDDVAGDLEGGDEEIAPEEGSDDEELDMGDEEGGDEELDMGDDEELDMGDDEDMDMDMDMGDEEMEDTSDDVEIDVTELVASSEESKESSEMANQKMEELMGQFDQLNGQLEKMNGLSSKIDDLEHEMETRMPTPEEKLEMRSLDSYPYNVKLTDYWADKEGQYDVMDGEAENTGKPKEYVLTSDEVDSDYSEIDVKKSIENPYEEEDMY